MSQHRSSLMQQLAGRAALITGDDSGIGQATAVEFAQQGVDVVIAYLHDANGAEHTRRQVGAAGRVALVVQADVSDPIQANRLFDQALAHFPELFILVNDAGTNGAHRPVAELDPTEFEKILRTDLFGPFYLCRRFVQHRLARGGKGKTVNVTFIHEEGVQAGTADYCATSPALWPWRWPRPASA